MIRWEYVWIALVRHPDRRRQRNHVGLEVFTGEPNQVCEGYVFPILPKDILAIVMANIIKTRWGDEVKWEVLPHVLTMLGEAKTPYSPLH